MSDGNHAIRNGDTGGDPSIASVEAELDATRQEMAHTLDELSARLDVKARSREAVHDAKARGKEAITAPEVRIGAGVAGAVFLGLAVLLVWRRRR